MCEVCGKFACIQLFYNNSGAVKYARARHYMGRENSKPKFGYHQQSLDFVERKLNQIPKSVNLQIVGHLGQIGRFDLGADLGTILESGWVVSSARIERQPSKLEVEGSNPSRPAFYFSLNYVLNQYC